MSAFGVIPPVVGSLIMAFMFYGAITALYKYNPIYSVLEALVIGAVLANEVGTALKSIMNIVLTPLGRGDTTAMATLLFGAMYFFIFTRKFSYVYRLICVITIACTFGTVQSGQLLTMYTQNMMWATYVTDVSSALLIVGVIATMIYFTFSKPLERPLRHIRTVGKLYLFAFFGISVGTMWYRYTNFAISYTLRTIDPPAVFVPFLILFYIILDATGVIGRIQKTVAPQAPTA